MIILYILLVPFAIVCVGAIIVAIVDFFKQRKRIAKEALIEEVQKRLEHFVKYEVSSQLTADPKALQNAVNLRKRFNTRRLCV
jgi:uncharacterized membrane protein (DUF106 family)